MEKFWNVVVLCFTGRRHQKRHYWNNHPGWYVHTHTHTHHWADGVPVLDVVVSLCRSATVGGNVIANTVAGVPQSPFQANKRLASPVIPGTLSVSHPSAFSPAHCQHFTTQASLNLADFHRHPTYSTSRTQWLFSRSSFLSWNDALAQRTVMSRT